MNLSISSRSSTLTLVADALQQIATLFQAEMGLARTEIKEKMAKLAVAAAICAGSGLVLFLALIFLLEGAVQLLVANGWSSFAANFLIGGIVAVIGIAAIAVSLRMLSASALIPRRTLDQLGQDARLAQEQLR